MFAFAFTANVGILLAERSCDATQLGCTVPEKGSSPTSKCFRAVLAGETSAAFADVCVVDNTTGAIVLADRLLAVFLVAGT